MALKRFALYSAATLTALTLAACGDGEDGNEAVSTTTTAKSVAIETAGGEAAILAMVDAARGFCHSETTFNGEPIGNSDFIPDEFQAAYVEDGGKYIRYIIAGTVDVRDGEAVFGVGYSCSYLQRQTKNAAAVKDNLGIVMEDEAVSTRTRGGLLYADLRDHLRGFHGVQDGDVHVYDEQYSTAQEGWDDGIASSPSPQSSIGSPQVTSAFGDGTHMVGTDIEPGTYRNDGSTCYWERLSGLSGEDSDRIENDFVRGQAIVEILPSDKAFKSQGCETWEMVE